MFRSRLTAALLTALLSGGSVVTVALAQQETAAPGSGTGPATTPAGTEPVSTGPMSTEPVITAPASTQPAPGGAGSPDSSSSAGTDSGRTAPGGTEPGGTGSSNPPTGSDAPEAGAEQSSLTLVRRSEKDGKDRRIVIVKSGTTDETGIFTICSPQDGEPDTAPNVAVFSETGAGGVQISIDKNVIRVPLAVVTQLPPKAGQEGSDGRVEASAGSARFLDEPPVGRTDRLSRCAVEATPKPTPDTVIVTQGRTELRGQKLVYDSADGVARIDGPVSFQRRSDADPLTGQSDRIEVSVDDEKTTLVGNVVLNSGGGRVSRAARVEYDDTRNVARLYGAPGQPAESVKGSDTLRAGVIVYDLERNEVYAVRAEGGTITGEFLDGEAAAPAPASGPPRRP